MSRALHVSQTETQLKDLCEEMGLGISVLEPLVSGGTRIVLNNEADAAVLSRRLKAKMIDGPVKRSPSHVSRQAIPYRS